MTSNQQVVSQVATVYIVLLFLGSRNQVGRTVWVLLNLRDTLRALKDVYPNGRRVGVVTRRRRLRAALAGWIVLVSVQPVTFAADTLLSWIPFYSSIKMLLVLTLCFWRLESSAFLFQTLVVPVVRRYETHIDLTLLLVGSAALLFFHFLVEIPWRALVILARRPSPSILRVRPHEPPALSAATYTETYPSHPAQRTPTSSGRHTQGETSERPKLKILTSTSPGKPRNTHSSQIETHRTPPATTRQPMVPVAKPGRVKAAVHAFDSTSARSVADRQHYRSSTARGRGKRAEDPSGAGDSGPCADTTQKAKEIPATSKPAGRRPMRPAPSKKTAPSKQTAPSKRTAPSKQTVSTRSKSHSGRVHAVLQTLPPAPQHDPQLPATGASQSEISHTTGRSTPTLKAEATRRTRAQKRPRPDDEEYQDRAISPTRSSHAMSTRSTPRRAKTTTKASAAASVQRGNPAGESTRTNRSGPATTKADTPQVKRARIKK